VSASGPPPRVRCHHCGHVIGVYEPLVMMTDSGHRETSLAAEPDLTAALSSLYHRTCAVHAPEGG
jgi:hypothetical protein